jgi:hypothetical protein
MANAGGEATCTSAEWLQTASGMSGAGTVGGTTTDMWMKIRMQSATLKSLGSGTGMGLMGIGALTGVGADKCDVGFQGVTGSKYKVQGVFNENAVIATSAGTDLQSALPTWIVPFIWYSTTLGTCGCTIFDDSGNSYASVSTSTSGNMTTGSTLISVNDSNNINYDANQANTYNGLAIYNSTPPTSGVTQYNPPTVNDSGLIYLSFMNDAPASSGAAAQVGTQALANNGGSVTYTGNIGALWGPPTIRRAQIITATYAAMHRRTRW